jgi:hypothetical protein
MSGPRASTLGQRRHYSRVAFDASAYLVRDGQHAAVRIIDLSLKGALVTRPPVFALQAGDRLRLIIHLGGATAEAPAPEIALEVGVAHVHALTLGLTCQRIELEALGELKRLMALNLGDEALLYRELAELLAPDRVDPQP